MWNQICKKAKKCRVTFEEKVRFTEKVKKLSQEGIAEFVELVQKICAGAVTEINAKKLQIKMNDIDKEAFVRLGEFLDEQAIETVPRKIKKIE